MFTTTVKRTVLTATAVLVTAAAPSAALADFSFTKHVDKSSPTIYQNAGGGSSTTTPPPAN
jgi:type VI protein secretion system component Hcp